jgi:hypothetical protein
MLYLILKATISGAIVAAVSEIAKRSPGIGGMLASLPLVSTLAMIWLWRQTRDPRLIAAQTESTFWFFLPSVPMFLVIPALLRSGIGFSAALMAGCVLTVVLYLAMTVVAPRLGIRL